MIHPALVNPFMFADQEMVGCYKADYSRLTDEQLAEEATTGYPCCVDCGAREPCDEHCPWSGKTVPTSPEPTARFQLDEAALMSEIEPVPAFLTRGTSGCYDPRVDDRDIYGAGEQTVGQSSERGHCLNRPALDADGLFRAGPTTALADEIEELLELARADEWPAPPRRMVG